MMYIVVVTSCPDCNRQAVSILEKKPTEDRIQEIKESIGGMCCINHKIYCGEMNEIAEEL